MSKPNVLISSTFYDLRQIRENLFTFLEDELGYNALAFESVSFPIDPDESTIENCRRRVSEDTDILLLIVGSRYGSVDPATRKSVTNIEYLAARAKRIPVFVFVEKQTLTLYELWKRGPATDFAGLIDNSALFTFIQAVREDHKAWTLPFETAQDITTSMRIQFASMFSRLLSLKAKIDVNPNFAELQGLSPTAFRLVLERPQAWEFKLISETLTTELTRRRNKKEDYSDGFTIGFAERVTLANKQWLYTRMEELTRVATLLSTLINTDYKDAIGPPGQSGDAFKIAQLSRRIGQVYEFCIDWAQRIRTADFSEPMKEVQKSMANFSRGVLKSLEEFGREFAESLRNIDEELAQGKPIEKNFTIDITTDGVDKEVSEALERARLLIASGYHEEDS